LEFDRDSRLNDEPVILRCVLQTGSLQCIGEVDGRGRIARRNRFGRREVTESPLKSAGPDLLVDAFGQPVVHGPAICKESDDYGSSNGESPFESRPRISMAYG
jgi:hypothetical protein